MKEIEKKTIELARAKGVIGVESGLTTDEAYSQSATSCMVFLKLSNDSRLVEEQVKYLGDALQSMIILCGLVGFPVEVMAECAYLDAKERKEVKENKINIKEEEEND